MFNTVGCLSTEALATAGSWRHRKRNDVKTLENGCYGENRESSSNKNDRQCFAQVGWRIHKMQ